MSEKKLPPPDDFIPSELYDSIMKKLPAPEDFGLTDDTLDMIYESALENAWSSVSLIKYLREEHAKLEAENARLRDRVSGLQADLESAVKIAWKYGATEWVTMNYPDHAAALTGKER